MNIEQAISDAIKEQKPTTTWIVAYSGGVDSHVLLHQLSLAAAAQQISVKAIHVNHGLHPDADQWTSHCLQECQKINIPLQVHSININRQPQQSLEAVARKERYAILQNAINKNCILVTGHHLDDQAETLLLQLFRGSGVKGLASMPTRQSFGDGLHIRPLLQATRDSIYQYANKHHLNYIHDDSNDDTKFTRNYIRHQVMPILKKQWPSISSSICRSSRHCADADQLLTTYAAETIKKLSSSTIDITAMNNLTTKQQQNILRQWISANQYQPPTTKQLQQIQGMISTPNEKQPEVQLKNYEIRRHKKQLYILKPLQNHNPSQVISWNMTHDLTLTHGLGTLNKKHILNNIPSSTDKNKITVRFRQGGERWKKSNQTITHCVKNLMQEENIEPWLRDRIPLIYEDSTLIYIDFNHINQLRSLHNHALFCHAINLPEQ
jgi:tRNA(Ile)-lysidine synthase